MKENVFIPIKSADEDYSCACCDLFWPGWAEQQLELHREKPNLLYRDLRDIIEQGFARYGWELLNRLIDLEGFTERARTAAGIMMKQTKEAPRPAAENPLI